MKTKEKKRIYLAVAALLAAAAVILGAKPMYNLYRDVSFGWTDHTEAEYEVKEFAESHGISIGEYPQYILDLYENNPETRDFVMNYPFRDQAPEVDLAAYPTDTVPLFLQWDPMWGYEKYGSSCIAVAGCGPTCLAMAGYFLTGNPHMTPDQVAKFAQRNGYYEAGLGSSWTLISEGAEKLGLTATELPLVKKKIVSALEAGSPVILALRAGDFTSSGHYIVLSGVEDGAFRVNDPNSKARSAKLWTYEELEGQIRNIWSISKKA